MKNCFSWFGRSIVLGSLILGTFPILTQASNHRRTRTIESLPDGNYHYKYSSNSEMLVFSFRKKGKMISAENGSLSEPESCFVGEVKGNSILKGFSYTIVYGRTNSEVVSIQKPRDISYMAPLTLQDAENASFPISEWIRSYLNRDPLSFCKQKEPILMNRFVATYGKPKSTSPSQVKRMIAN